MITFIDSMEKLKEDDKCLDSQLWHACAGGMVQMPLVNTKVYYFVQGHIEHASGNHFDFRNSNFRRIPPYILCRVQDIKYLADPETDEVYAKIQLIPLSNDLDCVDDVGDGHRSDLNENKPSSFAKTLTQSDANNGGGFSVPRYCAETIFPRLDYTSDPPVQNIIAKDVHGEPWKFRHIYRGTPRRHLLTTGWSSFVNAKKLIAGDSIVFLRTHNGDLCVGIRRAKRAFGGGRGGGNDLSSGWNPSPPILSCNGFSGFRRDNDDGNDKNGNMTGNGKGTVKMESVVEAVCLAEKGERFEIVYYPRAGTPEFVVKAGLVKEALKIHWSCGMRFKMPFETEDSSRISWFMGTVSSVQVADPIHWAESPWRLLQVTWDEPDLLQNVKRVSPWLVELVSNMPPVHISPFSPPRKKFRLPHHPDFQMEGQFPVSIPPQYSRNFLGPSNPSGSFPNNYYSPAGMQGARHAQFGLSFSDHNYITKLQPSPSLWLTIGNPDQTTITSDNTKPREFVLFGKVILTEPQISLSLDKKGDEFDLESGHCKVFMESEDVGRTLELTLLKSYEELFNKLANMFGLESSEMVSRVVYRDGDDSSKQIGDEPFGEFARRVKRLTILMDSSSDNVGM